MASTPPFTTLGSEPSSSQTDEQRWQALKTFNYYRLALSGLILILLLVKQLPPPLATAAPKLFLITTIIYVVLSLYALLSIHLRQPSFIRQYYFHITSDILLVAVLMYASGGLPSGLGVIFIISIATASMINSGRSPIIVAATATLAILTEETYSLLTMPQAPFNYPQAGLLGIALFLTALVSHTLANRLRHSEELALQRGMELANMARLTEYIIHNMKTGVLVVTAENTIRLLNISAWKQLHHPNATEQQHLKDCSEPLYALLQRWRVGEKNINDTLKPTPQSEIIPRFMEVTTQEKGDTLIFLEDATEAGRQAQQLKLASLGRLTASIAHEIRNPLAAIRHANQLLEESTQLDEHDQRMTEIINNQTTRVNDIIENVLQLGRREQSQPNTIHLKEWLQQYINDFAIQHPQAKDAIKVDYHDKELSFQFDAGQLQQIVDNLVLNGLHHARHAETPTKVTIIMGDGDPCFLMICDRGPGVNEDALPHIFDPFYTTETFGTGLGLYLGKELAQSNGANLDYIFDEELGSCFRLAFTNNQHAVS